MITQECTVVIKHAGRTSFIIVEGKLSSSATNPKTIAQEASAKGSRLAIINLKKSDEMDKEGLHWLTKLTDDLDSFGVKLEVVVKEDGKLKRILQLVQFDRFLSLGISLVKAWKPMRNRGKKKITKKINSK